MLFRSYHRYAEQLAAELQAERGQFDADTFGEREETVAREREIARAYRASEELLREKKRSSFGSLITGAVELLEQNKALRARLQNRYRYILVDEFQDTNIAQLRLLELLANESKNIFAVGDNDQAIYRFRGASFGSFKLFLERFAGWREGDDSTPFRVSLTENYRSTPNILRVASQIIGMNTVTADFPKKVLTASRPEGEKIRVVELAEIEDEALWVAKEIDRIHGAGRRWRDFAVLYRAHNHRDALVRELSRRKIPFVISRLSILEHPLVKDLIAYLRLIAKPYDDIAAARVLAAPAWRMSPRDLVRFAERVRVELTTLGLQFGGKLFRITVIVAAGDQFILTAREKLDEVAQELARLGDAAKAVELQAIQVAPQQNPVVHFVQHQVVGVHVF